ncbi:hypothetical protein [Mycobacterium sp. E2733]|uniref:hypothetical protein n=1 Tax=Mycobacterium sp. E2733 TaxID=1834138 RepID=UPI0007FF7C7B|nr:hypothetical protein [Mycobacterium sp. E2733]OBI00571.1 hypothetical protein A5678_19025 [Mycobacterium sp. E2733]
MTWTKLSDDFSDDCWELSDAAYRLHSEGLVWSNRKLLDCRLPKSDIRRWAKRPDAADELVACGWWRDIGDAYVIVHHAVYQRTRDAVLAQQDANQKNGQRGGRPKGPPRERRPRKRSTKIHSLTESLTERRSESVSVRIGSDVSETRSLTESKSESPTERDGTGLDKKPTTRVGELPVAAGAEWPRWRGQGSSPFDEYN